VWVGGRELGSRVRPRGGPLIPAKNS